MKEIDVLMSAKPLPQTKDEWLKVFFDKNGFGFDCTALTGREIQRRDARLVAKEYFFGAGSAHCPTQDIVIGVEHALPVNYNPYSGGLEYTERNP